VDEQPLEVRGGEPPTTGPVVSFGSPRRPGLFVVASLVVVVVLAVAIGSHRSSGRSALPTTTPSVPSTPETATRATTTASIVATTKALTILESTTTVARRTRTDTGGPMLASLTHTELIIHTLDSIVRVDLDRGVVVNTPVPVISSTGPTFMVVGASSVLLRPLDYVTGYLVPDDADAQPLDGRLSAGTLWAYPGDAPGSVWVEPLGARSDRLDLVGFETDFAGTSVEFPNLYPWGPDGTGQVVLTGVGGAYVTGSKGLTRVTTGDVFAAGPTKWLVRECDEHHACTTATIDRSTGHKDVLNVDSLAEALVPVTGVITADGQSAAIVRPTGELEVIDLTSGEQHVVATPASVAPVWSFDGRFLFFVRDANTVSVFDRATGAIMVLPATVDDVEALAVRPAP
jgi:hypothetical protein